MTIHEIKRRTAHLSPHFFTPRTMKFFGQTLKDFTVKKYTYNGVDGFIISAPVISCGKNYGFTTRFFNPITNKLVLIPNLNTEFSKIYSL